MEIRLHSVEPGLLCFRCRGALAHSLTNDSTDPLRTLLSAQSWKGNVLLDLREVNSIGTESIAWLIHWHRWITRSGGTLNLCCLPPRFSDIFGLCHLQQLIPIWEDERAARAALIGPPPAPAAPPAPRPTHGQGAEADLEDENGVIPMPASAPVIPTASTGQPEVVGRPAAKVVKILVVDDSAVERLRASSALEMHPGSDPIAYGGLNVLYASNGREALTIIQKTRPNLVVTDLVMPEMDGLELVKEVRSGYPSIPVVLMTAHGSEDIAAAALRAGAASYVPKKYLARDLGETIDSILRLARAGGEQLIFPHLTVSEYRFLLPNNLLLVSPLMDFLQGHLERIGLCHEVDELRVAIALREALVNAVTHGNLEAPRELRETDYEGYMRCLAARQNQSPYKDRRVHVTARETPQEVVYTVRDEGPGFNAFALPDPTVGENFKKATGRGLYLVRTFMDEVNFNDAGNEITLVKRRSE
jgi:CheY-like chemotaxis protein/anti-anti-sigma regulatory factor